MIVKLHCPTCKLQRQFSSWWNLIFGEDYATYKEEKVQTQMAEDIHEMCRLDQEAAELEREMEAIWKTIPQETLFKARHLEQKIQFLRERRNYLANKGLPNQHRP